MKFSIFSRNKAKSDSELLAAYRDNEDMEVLGELYNRYLEMVYGVCMKYFKNEMRSEDGVMEIFELIVKRLPNHKVDYFKSWLYRVSSNHCLDVLRKESRDKAKKDTYENMQLNSIPRLTSEGDDSWRWREEQMEMLEECLDSLKPEQKQSVSLFYMEGKSYDELSATMNISWSKVRSLIQNGKRNLKICVERKHETAGN